MSGGTFEYDQYRIKGIAEYIEQVIYKSGKKKTQQELKQEGWRDSDWYEKYPEDLCHYKHPDQVIEQLKQAHKALHIAYIYAHRVDYLLAGDDGDESFIQRLEQDLSTIPNL